MPAGFCLAHDPAYAPQQQENRRAGGLASGLSRQREEIDPPKALGEHSVRGTGWWLAEQLISDAITPTRANALARLLRALSQLGPEPLEEEAALRQVELRGRIMHGRPPRDEEEWELARQTFRLEAFLEVKDWCVEENAPIPQWVLDIPDDRPPRDWDPKTGRWVRRGPEL
jgi:hypothetical protein